MEEDHRMPVRRLWAVVMPGPVRSGLTLLFSGLFGAVGMAGAFVTLAGEIGWPAVRLFLLISAAALVVLISGLIHVLMWRALLREAARADRYGRVIDEVLPSTIERLKDYAGALNDNADRWGEIRVQQEALNDRLDKLDNRVARLTKPP